MYLLGMVSLIISCLLALQITQIVPVTFIPPKTILKSPFVQTQILYSGLSIHQTEGVVLQTHNVLTMTYQKLGLFLDCGRYKLEKLSFTGEFLLQHVTTHRNPENQLSTNSQVPVDIFSLFLVFVHHNRYFSVFPMPYYSLDHINSMLSLL